MSIVDYLYRIQRMDSLIRRKATGTPKEFAAKLGISRSMLFKYIEVIKVMDGPVQYSFQLRTYYYSEEVVFNIGFSKK